MKTLKFMLAVATAVGLATAVQAKMEESSTGFEGLNVGATVKTGVPDVQNADGTFPGNTASYFFYAGSNADDNESTIVEFTDEDRTATEEKRSLAAKRLTASRNKALQVSTGTDPLLRTFKKVSAGSTSATAAEYGDSTMYIDTLVQFTLTPYTDVVTPSSEDKLMIYLKETREVTPASEEGGAETVSYSTNLVALAGMFVDSDFGVKEHEYVLNIEGGEIVEPGKWYRLTVEAIPNIIANADYGVCMGFKISIDGNVCTTDSCYEENDELNETLEEVYDGDWGILEEVVIPLTGTVADGGDCQKLKGVGFAGEGKVDDFVFTSTEPGASVVDLTFEYDSGKVSAIAYTVGGVSASNESTTFEEVASGALVEITTLDFFAGYELDKYELVGLTKQDTTAGSVATFKVNEDATGTVSLKVVAKEVAASYPEYVVSADDAVKGKYDDWLADSNKGGVAGADVANAEKQFLLDVAATAEIADNALVIKSITKNDDNSCDIVVGCSVEGVGLTTPDGENAQVCNGYLAVSYTDDLAGSWTTENINVTAGTETGTVKVNVNKNGAKFMKVLLKTTKE